VLFDKPTLRTQASFASGIAELGGFPMIIDGSLAQIGVRESIADTARVLGRQASAIVWRTHEQSRLEEMAAYAGVPVVNALTDQFHPCQALADLLTIREHRGTLAGQTLAFVGDPACNMGHSLLLAGVTAGMHVRLSGPADYRPDPDVLARAQEIAKLTDGSAGFVADPVEAVTGADVVVTDTWISMGREAEAEARARVFAPWQLNDALLAHAASDAIAMHCLPAYRGKEITAEVLEGPRSVVWDEAENRRHVQKAVLVWLLSGGPS
jgi:ornithine carbamoyltransferase